MLHTQPTARELLDVVREFLLEEVVGTTSGAVSFRARIAANVLSMLERELELGPQGEERLAASLLTLDVVDERELALQIRAGTRDVAAPALVDALVSITTDRLRVANPRYLVAVDDDDPRLAHAPHHIDPTPPSDPEELS